MTVIKTMPYFFLITICIASMTFETATLPLGHDDIIKAASKLYMQHKKSPTIGKKSEICMQPIKLRLSDI